MKIASLILAIILICLIALVVLFEVTPDANPKEGGEAGLLLIFFVIPYPLAALSALLIKMSKEDNHK